MRAGMAYVPCLPAPTLIIYPPLKIYILGLLGVQVGARVKKKNKKKEDFEPKQVFGGKDEIKFFILGFFFRNSVIQGFFQSNYPAMFQKLLIWCFYCLDCSSLGAGLCMFTQLQKFCSLFPALKECTHKDIFWREFEKREKIIFSKNIACVCAFSKKIIKNLKPMFSCLYLLGRKGETSKNVARFE